MDKFVESVGTGGGTSPFGASCQASQVMDYYDGNTVTGLWNYAQRFAMSDNSYGTTFGPSAPGAINLVSGNTGGGRHDPHRQHPLRSRPRPRRTGTSRRTVDGGYSLTSDAQPYWDDCSTRDAVALSGKNIGDELNAAGLSWGWFQGGERPSISFADGARRDSARASRPARSRRISSRTRASRTRCRMPQTRGSATAFIRSASRSAEPASGATRTTTSRTTSRSTTTRRRQTPIT